jgi:inosine/xanthosine triphosphate pyrophosphatase family protein
MVTPITLVTGNAGKLREFNAILGSIVEMKAADVDLPELQGDKISLFLEYILNRLSFFR